MIFALNIWLLPAIAASSSSYLVSIIWERVRPPSAPSPLLSGALSALSFLMGAISSYYRYRVFSPSLENNIIIMFAAGAISTFAWLYLRRYLPGIKESRQ
jgi:zinc transporter ZupT